MTNTPMTKEDVLLDLYKIYAYNPNDAVGNPLTPFGNFCEGYQASQAQQASVIAELVEALEPLANFAQHYPKVKTFGNRPTEGDIHSVMDSTGEHSITVEDAHRAFALIAKVKGNNANT